RIAPAAVQGPLLLAYLAPPPSFSYRRVCCGNPAPRGRERPELMQRGVPPSLFHGRAPLSVRPATPAARMSTGSGSFLTRLRSARETTKIDTVGTSWIARRPRTKAAPAMAPQAAAVTPFTNALTDGFSA